ncbi:MFS general substrate transporter [Mycena floridula]|nr:MFS general substrate transporter [Mycena floridula]
MGSSSDIDEKHEKDKVEVSAQEVDVAAELVSGHVGELDPAEGARVLRKIDRHIMPLMCVLYWIQYMDKTTLGSSAILGIRESTHLTTNQYNWLGTIFYLSYLIFEFPQNLALQRFPVAKWMSFNILVWAIALMCHAASTNFAGLFVCRFILGMCEGSITAGFLIVSSMFYTRKEQTLRVGYWFLMNGTAQIISGFISFGSLHIRMNGFEPWQWLMIITGLLTLITATCFWFFFPDSPTSAWFLTIPERRVAIQRIKQNQTGVENKTFKKEQMMEALLDPICWLFALLAFVDNLPNSLTNQRQLMSQSLSSGPLLTESFRLITASFGFSNLQTTLLGCVDGVIEIVTIWTGVTLASRIPNSRALVGSVYLIPNILGVLLVSLLPWNNRIGLLFGLWITGVGTTGFVLSLSWLSSVTAGHTKKVTANAMLLVGYCIGNSVGPQLWQAKYKPRYRVPWITIGISYVICIGILLFIRFLLNRENKKRDAEPIDETYDNVYMEIVDADGKLIRRKVDKEFLDLTDRQNRDFRYVL